ncbi:MAG: winged helix-turn-helix domain-containing protein [Nautiliaceae bacterium]
MRVLIFDYVNWADFSGEFVSNEEEFFDRVIKDYDVVIVNFDFLSSLLLARHLIKGYVIFVTSFVDEVIYKKALSVGDFCYQSDEVFKIKHRLKYLENKLFKAKSGIVKWNNFLINLQTGNIYKNKELLNLTLAERDLLFYLLKNRDRFVSKEEIVDRVRGIDSLNSVKVIISSLRKKGFEIDNIKNLGYKINLKEQL